MNVNQTDSSSADDPYAAGLMGNPAIRHENSPNPAAMGVAFLAGIFAAALGAIAYWAVLRIFFPNTVLAISPWDATPQSIVLPGLVAVIAGFLVGVRVNRRLNDRFRKVKEAEVKRAVLAEQAADYKSRLRQTKPSRETTNS